MHINHKSSMLKKKESLHSYKRAESYGETITMNIDYRMFMRMCDSAAYLEKDDDYWDALWNFYSGGGEISGDAIVFFDNLFQYTDWRTIEGTYFEMEDDLPKGVDKETAIDEYLDEHGGEYRNTIIYKHGDHYLWVY